MICEMCPLRLILIFLSATLAGFFVMRNLKSQPTADDALDSDTTTTTSSNSTTQQSATNCFSKFRLAMESGFWTFVEMASGKYLWRHLVSSSSNKRSD